MSFWERVEISKRSLSGIDRIPHIKGPFINALRKFLPSGHADVASTYCGPGSRYADLPHAEGQNFQGVVLEAYALDVVRGGSTKTLTQFLQDAKDGKLPDNKHQKWQADLDDMIGRVNNGQISNEQVAERIVAHRRVESTAARLAEKAGL